MIFCVLFTAYYHDMFLRGRPGLALRMKRIKFKGQGPRKPASPQSEPNFWHMPFVTKPGDEVKTQQQQREESSRGAETPSMLNYANVDEPLQLWGCQFSSPPHPSNTSASKGASVPLVGDGNLSSLLDQLLQSTTVDGMPPMNLFRT